jgi:hypothetical protein
VKLLAVVSVCLTLAACGARSPQASIPASRALALHVSRVVFGSHAPTAFCLAGYETGHTYWPGSHSPTNDHGEWQIHDGLRIYGSRIYDIWFNARVAYRMSNGGRDWSPWTGTYGRGLCHGLD